MSDPSPPDESPPPASDPVVETPVVAGPVVASPVAASPVAASPVLESPASESPVVESPVVESVLVEPPLPPPEPPPEVAWTFWPPASAPRARMTRRLVVASWVVCGLYALIAFLVRCAAIPNAWTFDGDMPQAVWQYWRYHISGAFPPGDMLTDYAFVMHAPPVWWLLMSSLSSFFEPITAGKILNVIAYVGGVAAMYVGVARRSNHFVGLSAAILLVRTSEYWGLVAGGYARSFGPLLVIVFAGAFMQKRHTLCLFILVLQAALYPSVVIPCGLAYGLYTVVAGPMRDRLRRMAGMFVAGLLIIGFGQYQDIRAPKWWGSVVSITEAQHMRAWGPGGRVPELPLKSWQAEMRNHLSRGFVVTGYAVLSSAGESIHAHAPETLGAAGVLSLAALVAVRQRQRRRGREFLAPFPWQLPLLMAGSVAAYFLARFLAFRLYLPYRALQHVISFMLYMSGPLLLWTLLRNLMRRQLVAGLLVFGFTVVPSFLLFGEGIQGAHQYQSMAPNAKLFEFIRKMPQDAQFGGSTDFVDFIPLFAHHRVFMTRNLAHPFRAGYYQEAERRLRVMYQGLYAQKLADVVRISRTEKIDYWVFDTVSFVSLDRRLFQPLHDQLAPVFKAGKKAGFALARVPDSAVIYREGNRRIVDVQKLADALAADPTLDDPPAPETATDAAPFIGPLLEKPERVPLRMKPIKGLRLPEPSAVEPVEPVEPESESGPAPQEAQESTESTESSAP